MAVDNEVYEREASGWWDEGHPLHLLHGSVTTSRLALLRRALQGASGRQLSGLRVLDVGCGGGYMAEALARAGCRVTAVDASAASLATARAHAARAGLEIDYRDGSAERLPVRDAAFDVVCCWGVLEHVADVDAVLAEAARVLVPGGVFAFDTVNRTWTSWLVGIKVLQDWPWTRAFDAPVHDWRMFLPPGELLAALARQGLRSGGLVGSGPRTSVADLVLGLAQARRGRLSYGELSRRMDVGEVRSTRLCYAGWASAGLPAAGAVPLPREAP